MTQSQGSNEDFDSLREFYDFLKEHNRRRRSKNYDAAKAIKRLFTAHTEWHWSREVAGKRLDYWPSSSKWRWNSKSYNGTPDNLLKFMHNREQEANGSSTQTNS